MMRRLLGCAVALLALATGGRSFGDAITSTAQMDIPQTVIDFSQFVGANQFFGVSGPVQIGGLVGEDVEALSATSDLWLFNAGWGLAANGNWDSGRVGFLGIFAGSGPVRIAFNDGPVSGVGGFLNYPAADPGFLGMVMSVFDSGNNLLESFDISGTAPISTPGGLNEGAFRGIQRDQADIAYMELTGFAGVMDDLRFTRGAQIIPEPSSLALVGFGAIGVLHVIRRSRRGG